MPRKKTSEGTSRRRKAVANVETATLELELGEPELGSVEPTTEAQLDAVVVKPVEEVVDASPKPDVEEGPDTETELPVVEVQEHPSVLDDATTVVAEPSEIAEPVTEETPVVVVTQTQIVQPTTTPTTAGKRPPMPPEQKEKLRVAVTEYYKHNDHPMKGKTLSQTVKDNIAAARRAQQPVGKSTETGRPIYKQP